MKKIMIISAAALAAVVLSCQKNPIEEPVAKVPVQFTAGMVTRTAIAENGKSITWSAGDKVSVFDQNIAMFEFSTGESGATAQFKGEVNDNSTALFCLYPYSADAKASIGEATCTFTTSVKESQGAVLSGIDKDALVAVAPVVNKESVQFLGATAILRFTLTRSDVASVKFTPVQGALSGAFGIEMNKADGSIVSTTVPETPTAVTVAAAEGAMAPGTYNVSILPGKVTGMSVEFANTEGKTVLKESTAVFTPQSGHIVPLGNIDDGIDFSGALTENDYTVSKTAFVSGESITFTFKGTASDVKWSWKEGSQDYEVSGATVTCAPEVDYGTVEGNTPQTVTVTLSADGKTLDIPLTVTPYAFYYSDFVSTSFRYGAPVSSVDGKTVYMAPDRSPSKLFAFDTETGALKWTFNPSEGQRESRIAPVVNPVNGDIYYTTTTAGEVFAVKSDGTQRWKYEGLGAIDRKAPPVVSADGSVVYFSDGSKALHAVNATSGEKVWGITLGANVTALVLTGGELFAATAGTTAAGVFLKASDGSQVATVDFEKAPNDTRAIAVDPRTGIAYVTTSGSNQTGQEGIDLSTLNKTAYVMAIDLKKHESVVQKALATNAVWTPVILPNGNVVIGDKDGYVTCLNPQTLDVVWQFGSWCRNGLNYGAPCVDTDGNIYIAYQNGSFSSSGYIFKIAPDGTLVKKWANTKEKLGPMSGQALVGGVFYVGAYTAGVAWGKYVGATLATAGWPCLGGNPQNTSCF